MEGNTVAGNTLDRVLFQRAINFIGHMDMSDYTMEADVMTDGDRRIKSNIGLIISVIFLFLLGTVKKLEVVSISIALGTLFHFPSKPNHGIVLKQELMLTTWAMV